MARKIPDEVLALEWSEPLERGAARRLVGRHDHVADDGQPVGGEEHVLGAHQPDALGTERPRPIGVGGGIGVGPHPEAALPVEVGPAEELAEIVVQPPLDGLERVQDHLAGPAVHRDDVALADGATVDLELAPGLVDRELGGPDDTGLPHADRDDGSMRGPPSARGHDALGRVYARDVLGRGLRAHQNHPLAALGPLHRAVGVEYDPAHRSAGPGRQATRQEPSARDRRGPLPLVEDGSNRLVHLRGPHAEDRGVLVDHVLLLEVDRHLHRGPRRALAAPRLQEVERPLLDRELDVLHVLVVPLEPGGDLAELGVCRRHALLQGLDRQGRADSRHHVLALGVREELGVEARLARAGVPREAHPGPRRVSQVAEHHRHDGHGGAPFLGHAVDAAVLGRLLGEPGVEDRVHRQAELLAHVLGKRLASPRRDLLLVRVDELAQLVGGDVRVGRDAEAGLHGVEVLGERLPAEPQHDAREHREEPAVAVPGETLVARARLEPLDGCVVEPEVQDRLHHSGHGHAGARPDRHEEGTLAVAEPRVGRLLEPREVLQDLLPETLRPLAPRALSVNPGLGRDGEAGRDRDAEIRHLGQLAALAAEEVPHHGRAFRPARTEEVDVLGHPRVAPRDGRVIAQRP